MPKQPKLTISVIVPVFRDITSLTGLLEQLNLVRHELLEIIVVDGDVTPACQQLCATFSVHWLAAEPCRGAQLRAGANIAAGDILWFLQADVQIPPQSITVIRAAVATTTAVGGYFRFALQGRATLAKQLFTKLVNWRTIVGIPYGDQGIFVRASSYCKVDGHRPIPLFEEVRLIRRLRKIGSVVRLALEMPIDPRRYQRDGWLRRCFSNRLLALGYGAGIDPFRLAAWYRSSQTESTVRVSLTRTN